MKARITIGILFFTLSALFIASPIFAVDKATNKVVKTELNTEKANIPLLPETPKSIEPNYSFLVIQGVGGIAGGIALGTVGAITYFSLSLLNPYILDMYGIALSISIGYNIGSFLGVSLVGLINSKTTDYGITSLWALGGLGISTIGFYYFLELLSLSLGGYRSALFSLLFTLEASLTFIVPPILTMIGYHFNLKDMPINPVSVSAYEIEKNGQMVTDLVITANVLSIAF